MVQKITFWEPGAVGPSLSLESIVAGTYRTAATGAQVANMSFGLFREANVVGAETRCASPSRPHFIAPWCLALDFAASRDVLMFAAAGNFSSPSQALVQFPASEPSVIPVSGLDRGNNRWLESGFYNFLPGFSVGSTPGPELAARGLAALARDVPSTIYANRVWSDETVARCSDLPLPPANLPDMLGVGYGRCTGTSMATPFVAGIGALLRTLDPLRRAGDVANAMRMTAANAASPNSEIGHGRPVPMGAVSSITENTNRLTPLFAFVNSFWGDRFYTVVPQMAAAATQDSMARRDSAKDWRPYVPEGTVVSGYPLFPSWEASKIGGPIPRAQVWVFATQRNPFNPSVDLVPIWRFSYACYSNPAVWKPTCATNPRHIDHAYTTDLIQGAVWNFTEGYLVDGWEGYLVPATEPQPPGTVAMQRGVRDGDWAFFPSTESIWMVLAGYAVEPQNLGWAYLNSTGQRPVY
jgi:hypothetical protein